MEAQTAALPFFISTKSDICNYHGAEDALQFTFFPFKYFPSNPSQNKITNTDKKHFTFSSLTFKSCKFSVTLFSHIPYRSLKRFMDVIIH